MINMRIMATCTFLFTICMATEAYSANICSHHHSGKSHHHGCNKHRAANSAMVGTTSNTDESGARHDKHEANKQHVDEDDDNDHAGRNAAKPQKAALKKRAYKRQKRKYNGNHRSRSRNRHHKG